MSATANIFLDRKPYVKVGDDALILVEITNDNGENVRDTDVELIVPNNSEQNTSRNYASTICGRKPPFHFELKYTPELPEGETLPYQETVTIRATEYSIDENFTFDLVERD